MWGKRRNAARTLITSMSRGAEAGDGLIRRKYIEPMLFSRLLQHVPSQCAVCRSWGDQPICATCIARFAAPLTRCVRCAAEVPPGVITCGACLLNPPAFDAAVAAVDYAHPWSTLITDFKFHAALDLTEALTALLAQACRHSAEATTVDLLLPVPLSASRLKERGFNQSWEIARALSKGLSLAADPRLLLRVKDTQHQTALAPDRREANVRGAFAVEPLRRAELAGRRVAVVDDVMTTGATLAEIARVLKQAGALHVEAWVLARTPRLT